MSIYNICFLDLFRGDNSEVGELLPSSASLFNRCKSIWLGVLSLEVAVSVED